MSRAGSPPPGVGPERANFAIRSSIIEVRDSRVMLMRRFALIFSVWFAGALAPLYAQGNRDTQQLTQYVRDALKAGLNSRQIRQNAVKGGWAEAEVDAAFSATDVGKVSPPAEPSVTAGTTPAEAATATADTTSPEGTKGGAEGSKSAAEGVKGGAEAKGAVEGAKGAVEGAKGADGGTPPVAAVPPPDAGAPRPKVEGIRGDDYLIGEGDVLQVSVWGEPAASVQSATVRPDGKISMPLIKEVAVAGLTPAQVEAGVQEQLAKVIRAPDVTVIVAQINSKKIFLTGAVKREGPLKFTYRMTVLQAISEAGGLSDYAKRKNIYVLHTENGRQFRLPFNYPAVLKGENMEQNILLSPGDTIVVP
jgi:polysaccharide biosynthesis/export protein